jgi:DNA-nicking Smr family endonuclease
MPGNEDDEVWKVYARGVKPLPRVKKVKAVSVKQRKAPAPLIPETPVARHDAKIKRPARLDEPLDHNLERKLRQGSVAIEARLDLHGMQQIAAHVALEEFLAQQVKAGRRCLLVITGKGRGGEGVLRGSLAGWLASSVFASHILALRPASVRHGGAGAFYLMLRRKK